MKIFLANPPWITKNGYGVSAGSRWPFTLFLEKNGKRGYVPFPFFLAYAAALLKKHKKNIVFIDAVAEGLTDAMFLNKVRDYEPDVIVLETSTPSFYKDILIVKKIKNSLKDVKIVLAGPHVSVFPFEVLENYDFIDYILMGVYEHTLLYLINSLEDEGDHEKILSLAYRKDKTIKVNSRRLIINDIDSLPWPERESLSMYDYNDGFCNLPTPNVQVMASRGCPYECTFCLWPQVMYKEHVYRKRNPKKVVDEIIWLINRYDFKAIYFDDDTFNIDRQYVLDICHEIKNRGLNTSWAIMARPDLMDEELLKFLKQAGLYAVKYGIESADKEVLEGCNKNMDFRRTIQSIKFSKQLGIKVHLTFCLGLPGENEQSINRTIRFIEEVNPDSVQFSLATPFPGTKYFEYVKRKGWLFSEAWTDFDGNGRSVIRTKDLSKEYLERMLIFLQNKKYIL